MNTLELWDLWIRQGQGARVRRLCQTLNSRKIPRKELLGYAQIARRVGASELILKWLHPLVHPEQASSVASPQERALYGLGLLRVGAFREASLILDSITPEEDPQVVFYRASLAINQWDYQTAIPLLRAYIRDHRVPVYSRRVGRLNLCAALVSLQKLDQAETEIEILLKKLRREKLELLTGNLLEIRSQLFYEKGLWQQALGDLESATQLLKAADPRSQLYVSKWKALINQKRNPDLDSQLSELKTLAFSLQDWETARDCDLKQALEIQDLSLALFVYKGTLFSSYKCRIQKLFGGNLPVEDNFFYETPAFENSLHSRGQGPEVDLVQEAPTKLLKSLFYILTRDFYRPLRLTEIFDFVYPSEFYNPRTSPDKVHNLIQRGRIWLQKNNISIQIQAHRKAYKIGFTGSTRLLLKEKFSQETKITIPAALTEATSFTSVEWALIHQVSLRTARRQISALVEKGLVAQRNFGPRTLYHRVRIPET